MLEQHFLRKHEAFATPTLAVARHPLQSRLARNADFLVLRPLSENVQNRAIQTAPVAKIRPEPSEALYRVPRQASKRGFFGQRGAWPGSGAEFLVKMSVWHGLRPEFLVNVSVWQCEKVHTGCKFG